MKKALAFNIPFSCFSHTNFINCFASTYMFLEGIDDGKFQAWEHPYYCLFDTLCGSSSLRCRFDGEQAEMRKRIGANGEDDCGTDYTVDFLFGFAGYEYRTSSNKNAFRDEIIASIDAGKPVIARVRPKVGLFRVITGYDGDALISPEYTNAKNKPESAPSYDEIEMLYIIGDKTAPRHTLKDGLERIRQVMENNIEEKPWDEYIEKIGGWILFPSNDGLDQATPEEGKARMERLTKAMWCAMNCHNFGETFRNCCHEELRNPAFSELWKKISDLCYGMDSLIYAVDYLNNKIDWINNRFTTAPGISAMIVMAVEKVKGMDMELLEIIRQAIDLME